MKALVYAVLISTLVSSSTAAQTLPQDDAWRAVAERIDPGSRIKVRTRDGQRITATLVRADSDAVRLQPRTRVPVPVQRVAYEEIVSMERDEGRGIGAGKAVAIGLASGVAAFLGTLLIVVAAGMD
jgi:hypothetical protein